jgi:hypothetical protein
LVHPEVFPPHLSPSPLGDLVLAWLELGRGVSSFFSFSSSFFAYFWCMGVDFCGDGLVNHFVIGLGFAGLLLDECLLVWELRLSLSLGFQGWFIDRVRLWGSM